MLIVVLQTVKEAGVKNYLVVAIDTKLRDHLSNEGSNVYYRDVKVRRPLGIQLSASGCSAEETSDMHAKPLLALHLPGKRWQTQRV